ncbi:hypothetical protein [uncultured Clostridium sp.]|uniref:hypothetical protein n=1 Tax=uncultured Clostridium sp. TaxID=59620 RepID=UPI0025EBFE4A|nr:hypothetical protein [uncultured Clostridium sp.]
MEETNIVALVTAIGVILTAIMAGINMYISTVKNKKTNYINTITTERIRWMTSLKEMISEFCSLSYKDMYDMELTDYSDEVKMLESRIKLYLNPIDDKEIVEQLEVCVREMMSSRRCPSIELDKLVTLSQKMFKKEWERVKKESIFEGIDILSKKNKIWPNTVKQWFRVIISILGIILTIIYIKNKISFEDFAGYITIFSFTAYLIEGLLENIEERAKEDN